MEQLKSYESYINGIPLVLDPCRMCGVYKRNNGYETVHREEDGSFSDGICQGCCWFYDSQFEVGI